MKTYSVEGYFPEAIAHKANQFCRVKASTIGLAAKRGLTELTSRDGIRGKRIKTVRLVIRAVESVKDVAS